MPDEDDDFFTEEELRAAMKKFFETRSYNEKVDWKQFPELDVDPEGEEEN